MVSLTIEQFNAAVVRFNQVEAEVISIWRSSCECSAPGEREECWNCPYYKQLGQLIQKRLDPEPQHVFAEIPPLEFEDPYSEAKQLCCEMYSQGCSIDEIQYLVGIPLRKILRGWLREVGLPGRSSKYPEDIKQHCLELYADRWPVHQIEKATGVPADTITDWALHAGLTRKCKYSDETKQKCLELYQAGHTSNDIHAMTGIHPTTISSWIAKANIGREQKRYLPQEKQHCLNLYLKGQSPREIEAVTGIKQGTIRSWIRQERVKQDDETVRLRRQDAQSTKRNQDKGRKPIGYWKNLDNVKHEIQLLNEARGQIGIMPTVGELQQLGRSDLQHAICDHGGYHAVAEQMSLAYRQKKGGYWSDFENLQQELFKHIKEHGEPGVMPTKKQLEKAGQSALSVALTFHGGVAEVAKKLKLRLSYTRKPQGYWKNLENLQSEIDTVARELGQPGVLPSHEQLKQLERTDLISGIADNGGWPVIAQQLGFSYSKS